MLFVECLVGGENICVLFELLMVDYLWVVVLWYLLLVVKMDEIDWVLCGYCDDGSI